MQIIIQGSHKSSGTDMTPLTEKMKISCGQTFTYFEGGKGETIFLIHGFPSPFSQDYILLSHLAESYHVVAVNLPGFNTSSTDTPPAMAQYSPEMYSSHLSAFIRSFGISRYALAGISLGGILVLHLTQYLYPWKIILIETPLGGVYLSPKLLFRPAYVLLTQIYQRKKLRSLWYSALKNKIVQSLLFGVGAPLSRTRRKNKKKTLDDFLGVQPEAVYQLMTSLYNSDFSSLCRSITVPTLLVVGEKDRLVSPRQHALVSALIRDSHLVCIPGAEHWNTVNEHSCRIIHDFLGKPATAAGN
ncbi:hypothetical protein COY95_00225 [Candidatus Woesearchaeota archaeon CG_4_10_14_0_8_um_filter_47_5]|nr:MAG: hypothetical protein COY95_00225 [Candidatus Woesearchaeota archaeon CG_4_10_14_0_8_um_filter_47_5]